jgi:hypothetical protein
MKAAETTITRRTFAAGLTLATAIRAQNTPAPPIGQPHRYERIRRLGQLNINEKDTPDVDRWIRYSSSFRVDGLIVSAGGILGFHPTEVPYHKRSRQMGDRGLYGDYAAAARRTGIRLIARLDPTYAFPKLFEALPRIPRRQSQAAKREERPADPLRRLRNRLPRAAGRRVRSDAVTRT